MHTECIRRLELPSKDQPERTGRKETPLPRKDQLGRTYHGRRATPVFLIYQHEATEMVGTPPTGRLPCSKSKLVSRQATFLGAPRNLNRSELTLLITPAIMLLIGCSPFVSLIMNFSPKSQNICLKWNQNKIHSTYCTTTGPKIQTQKNSLWRSFVVPSFLRSQNLTNIFLKSVVPLFCEFCRFYWTEIIEGWVKILIVTTLHPFTTSNFFSKDLLLFFFFFFLLVVSGT